MANDSGLGDRTLGARFWFRCTAALVRRPGLWPTALAQAVRMVAPGWWRRPPYLPRPDPGYVRFRIETAYGAGAVPSASDLVAYLEWCRDWRRREG